MCTNNYLLKKYRKGFIPGVSGCLEHNSLPTECLKDARNNERQISVTWLDFENAFSSVRHELLLKALNWYNVPTLDGRLLVHWAALSGNENLVEYLLDSKSPVDPLDETNVTPIILAASAGRVSVVRLLIGRGADIEKKTNRSQSALLYACSKGYKEVVQLLIDAGADVNTSDVLGATPLHRAAAQGRVSIVELLLQQRDIEVDAQDKTGSTALHMACEEDREAISVMLVKAGADIDSTNAEKKTPVDLCSPRLKNILLNIRSE